MKLKKIHLFLILLAVLVFSSFGLSFLEGNENLFDSTQALKNAKLNKAGVKSDALSEGNSYNPFNNNETTGHLKFRGLNAGKKEMKFSDSNGVTKDEIPHGDEHLYMLKSEIVPPVCPKCPECPKQTVKNSQVKKECPPCPSPERCPEPAFTCKKVPNYNVSSVDSVLPSPMFVSGNKRSNEPMPVLNSFARFA